MAYSEKVVEHFNNPRNIGSLDRKDPGVGTGIVGAPECGDVMRLQIKVDEEVTLEGDQFVGWDPVAGQIRSWTFDSEGGFGEGRWIQDGNRWLVKKSFVVASGERASAVNVITYVDPDTFRWQSISREIAGELQPEVHVGVGVLGIDGDGPGEGIDGHLAELVGQVPGLGKGRGRLRLRQDRRDTTIWWFYWYFRVTGAAGRELRFQFADGQVILFVDASSFGADEFYTLQAVTAIRSQGLSTG